MKDQEGFEELARAFENAGKTLSDKELGRVVRKASNMALQKAKAFAPADTGLLRESIVPHKEKPRSKGKVVYDIMFDPEKNDVLQKPIKNRIRSRSEHAYYPASQEYGYFTRRPGGGMTYTRSDGTKATMDKVPGKHFMLAAAEDVSEAVETTILTGIQDITEKELKG